jgi:DNA-3-methyladenine glycosylase I
VLITLRLHHIPRLIEFFRHAAQYSKRQQLQAEAVPLQAEAVPLQAEAVPLQAEAVPLQAEAVPLQAEAVPLLSIPSPPIAVASASSDSSNTLEGSQERITGRRGQPIRYRSLCRAAEREREFQIYDSDMQQYHDHTWGRPETDESRLFESQTLQLMQCGLSCRDTAWRQREHFRRAFKNYDVVKVASFNKEDIEDLMAWPDGTIIRNRAKLRAVVRNARLILSMARDSASGSDVSFAELLWIYCPADDKERFACYPSKSVYALSLELKRRGFAFMGACTVLSFMQVCHRVGESSQCVFVCAIDCFRWQ